MGNAFFLARRYAFGGRRQSISRAISLLSVIGLTLGTGLLIAVISVMNGFDRELRERILVLVPHVRLYSGDPIANWPEVATRLASQPGVTSATPYSEHQTLVRSGSISTAMTIYAVDAQSELESGVLKKHLGSDIFRKVQNERGLYLGQGLANRLAVQAGDSVSLIFPRSDGGLPRPSRIPVLGTLHTGTELDHRLGLTSLETLSSLLQEPAWPQGISLHVKDPFSATDEAMLALRQLPSDYRANTWSSTHGNLYEAIQTSRSLVALIVFLILAIAAFNVLASLMITSADRQTDIAVLKTLGADRLILMQVFTLQGLLIGLIGSLAGVLLGLLICAQLDNLMLVLEQLTGRPLINATIYPLDYLPVDLHGLEIVTVALVAIVLSTLASLYPAWRLQSIQPAETLRYE